MTDNIYLWLLQFIWLLYWYDFYYIYYVTGAVVDMANVKELKLVWKSCWKNSIYLRQIRNMIEATNQIRSMIEPRGRRREKKSPRGHHQKLGRPEGVAAMTHRHKFFLLAWCRLAPVFLVTRGRRPGRWAVYKIHRHCRRNGGLEIVSTMAVNDLHISIDALMIDVGVGASCGLPR